jgi:hypothetical protein
VTKKTFGFAAMLLAIATAATLAIVPDAFAAVPDFHAVARPGGLAAFVAHASLGLAGLRAQLTDLTTRATAKLAEIKDDTADDVAQRIEGEHAALLTEVEATRASIARAEADEAARNRPTDEATRAIAREAAESAMQAERVRGTEIRALAKRSGMNDAAVEKAISGNVTVDAFRVQAFDHMASQDALVRTGPIKFGQDEQQTRVDAAIVYLLHRSRPADVKLTDAAREFRGMTLIDLARDFLESHGERCRGMTKDELAKRALHSTSDFPSILENVANKSLRRTYEAYPQTFRSWTSQENASDFKAKYLVQLGEAPQLEKVNQSGEFKRGTISEGKQSLKVETYGKIFGITRQTLVNDDLGAFTRIPGIFGTSIATLESDIVWGLITANAAMADGVALFHANHNNLVGAGTALSIDSISKTRTLMRKQKGLDGKTRINVRPKTLLVPPELETIAEQILNQLIVPNQTSSAVPASIKSLQVESEPRLSDNSATAFYLAGDPGAIDTLVYSYLEGQEGAYIESRMGFDVDGMEVKCRLDFGAAVVDFRGLAKNPGA